MKTKTTQEKIEGATRRFAGATGSEWGKAKTNMQMANAAFKLAARNEHGAAMVIEQLKQAIQTLEAQTPNARGQAQPPETDSPMQD